MIGLTITEGENPERRRLEFAETWPLDTRINPPPDSGPAWWWTGKQWRKNPPRKPSIDREGIHLLIGLFFAALPWIAQDFGFTLAFWGLMAVQGMAIVLFLAYEITEGWRIKDWAYRDIGGFFIGAAIPPAWVTFAIINKGWLNWF